MKTLLRLLQWMLKAALFFTLFAFALNNQQTVNVHFFFGRSWQAPLVLVVLAVFALGVLTGVLGMLPQWWRLKRNGSASDSAVNGSSASAAPTPTATTNLQARARASAPSATVTPASPPDAVATP